MLRGFSGVTSKGRFTEPAFLHFGRSASFRARTQLASPFVLFKEILP
ncbi:hypothetical protein EPIR_2701 [Erwinia piriflorinigrans CFBP 5888]|uniref:Uncharacterized protein n=1 Tax=Erwinia piriflorinigrans CFBP 5888 TaxID=1161919 RepID=V5ZAT8_9GAMM|nr:hypothetical protein EPIR_2701 [Erwinia piriflorinigrans CFBP 5888]